jgi:uncharacterized membrane protein
MENKTEPWEGPSSHLYEELHQIATKLKLSVGGRDGFPKDPKWLWRKIQIVRPNLSDLGIQVSRNVTKEHSIIQITNMSNEAVNITTDTSVTNLALPKSGDNDGITRGETNNVTIKDEVIMATDVTEVTEPDVLDNASIHDDLDKILGLSSDLDE